MSSGAKSATGAVSSAASREAAPTASAVAKPGSASTPVASGSASAKDASGSSSASTPVSMTPAKLYPAMVDLMKNKVLYYFQQCQSSAKPSNDHTILYDLMARLYMEIERVYPMPSSTPASSSGLGPLPSLPSNASASSVGSPTSSSVSAPAVLSSKEKEKDKDATLGLGGGAVSEVEMRRSSLTRLQSAPVTSSRSSITIAASAASPSSNGRPSSSEANPFVLTPAHFRKYDWQDEQCRLAYENATLLSQLLTEGEPDESTHLSDIVMECVGSLREVTIKVSKRLMTAAEKDEKIIRELFCAQEASQAILTHHYKLLNHILSPGAVFTLPKPPVTALTNEDGTRRHHPLFYNQPHALKSAKQRDAERAEKEKKSEVDSKAEADKKP